VVSPSQRPMVRAELLLEQHWSQHHHSCVECLAAADIQLWIACMESVQILQPAQHMPSAQVNFTALVQLRTLCNCSIAGH
jgi:hypothetical protein